MWLLSFCVLLIYIMHAPSCIALDQRWLRTSRSWDHSLRVAASGDLDQSRPISFVHQPIIYLHSCCATIFNHYNFAEYCPVSVSLNPVLHTGGHPSLVLCCCCLTWIHPDKLKLITKVHPCAACILMDARKNLCLRKSWHKVLLQNCRWGTCPCTGAWI
jgi:hypothetical protein